MTKQTLKTCCKAAWIVIKITILLLIPCIAYLLFEYVTGNWGTVSPSFALLNIAWIYLLYLLAFVFSANSTVAIPVVSILLFLVSVAENLVMGFRGRPIMISDVLAFNTAMTVASNYKFALTEEMYLACLGIQAICIAAIAFPIKIKKRKYKIISAGAGAGIAISFAFWFYTYIIPFAGLSINMWAPDMTYGEYGYVLSTAVSIHYLHGKKLEGYGTSGLKQIYEQMKEEDQVLLASAGKVEMEEKSRITPVNIICIMNESLSELKAAGEFETNIEYFPYLNALKENTVKGSLCMPVFGSLTSNSEFEFLTGDSIALLAPNSIAYQFNVKPDTYGLVSVLKAQGYETVAMHPYPGKNWNREACYKNMGIEEFLDIKAYEGSEELRNYISDYADYQKLIERVEAKENPQDKLFLFNVTMQNHGGYEDSYDNFDQEVWLTGDFRGKYPKADQYLSLIKRSDEALQSLISYFAASQEPTMIVLFGDHQPSVEDEFFEKIAGKKTEEVPYKEHLMWYETPFFIWTNYDSPKEEMGRLGAIYLGAELLKRAGLEMTPFQKFLLSMEETFPVVHPIGCYGKDGTYYSWNALDVEDSFGYELMLKYKYLVYNHIFDNKKYEELFVLDRE